MPSINPNTPDSGPQSSTAEPVASGAGVQLPGWRELLLDVPAVTLEQWHGCGWLRRWLVATRASVLPLTLFACLFAGLLAAPLGAAGSGLWLLATVGLTLAHATNNLLNDHVDFVTGLDRDNYFRAKYGAHPLAGGLVTPRQHRVYVLTTGLAAALAAVVVCAVGGLPVVVLTLAGAFFVLFYTWPLKRWALGELSVLLVWGPLMVGGLHLLLTGGIAVDAWVLGLLYGLGPTVVIFAKHTDKAEDDRARGVRTLPTLLGQRTAARVTAGLAQLQVAGVMAFAFIQGAPGYALVLFALPAAWRLAKACASPRPSRPPQDYPDNLWPLWYTVAAFGFARAAGMALVAAALAELGLKMASGV